MDYFVVFTIFCRDPPLFISFTVPLVYQKQIRYNMVSAWWGAQAAFCFAWHRGWGQAVAAPSGPWIMAGIGKGAFGITPNFMEDRGRAYNNGI